MLRIAAVVGIVALVGWNLLLQNQLNGAEQYQRDVAAVLQLAAKDGSMTAVLRPAESSEATGLAAMNPDGTLTLAVHDLAPTKGNEVYEAWLIGEDQVPVAIGGFEVGRDGIGYLATTGVTPADGIQVVLTLEPAPDATAPAGPVVSVGSRRRPSPERQAFGAAAGSLRTWPRPSARAAWSAAIAAAMSSSASEPSTGKRATPAETETLRPATAGRAAIPSMTRWATVAPAEPGAISTNSSPPIRPTVSTRRTDSASTAATRRRTSSPAACPPSRLVAWKSSMSKIARETSLALPAGAGQLELEDPADRPLVGESGQRRRCGRGARTTRSVPRRSRRGARGRS